MCGIAYKVENGLFHIHKRNRNISVEHEDRHCKRLEVFGFNEIMFVISCIY